jgi:hypothetical protein
LHGWACDNVRSYEVKSLVLSVKRILMTF